jgi:hypothetical protein
MKRQPYLALVFIALTFFQTAHSQTKPTCTLTKPDQLWIENAVRLWQTVSHDSLRIKNASLPWLVLFDETCIWHVNPNLSELNLPTDAPKTKISYSGEFANVYGIVHKGKITLPDRQQIRPQLIPFVGMYRNDVVPFLVFAMPSIWQKAPHLKTESNLETLIRAVFVHEMTHTRHHNFFNRINRIEKTMTSPEDFDDDIVQNHFGKIEDFRKAYETEREFLYQAVRETDLERKREFAKNALDVIKTRHKQFMSGNESVYVEIEDIFLTMEGVANWAAYCAAIAEGLSRTDAIKLIRRNDKRWSQDEGLAVFLVIDSLLPNWQQEGFGNANVSVTELLGRAVNHQRTRKSRRVWNIPSNEGAQKSTG